MVNEAVLDGRKLLVTGAPSGIDRAAALRPVREGAGVCVDFCSPRGQAGYLAGATIVVGGGMSLSPESR